MLLFGEKKVMSEKNQGFDTGGWRWKYALLLGNDKNNAIEESI